MENRIDTAFASLRAAGRKAFVAYICAGDPTPERTPEIVRALEAAGVDIVELGIPFSDPLADGIVNQLAAQRALDAGTTTAGVLEIVRKIREFSNIPIVLFTYLNPVYAYGFQRFHEDAAAAGADGVLLLDLPPDEAPLNPELPASRTLRSIRLIAPTTPPDRMVRIARDAGGFIYYISREGVTGVSQSLAGNLREQVDIIRSSGTNVPVCVGFGISTPEQARAAAAAADGVVVGSAIVSVVAAQADNPDLAKTVESFVKPLVSSIRNS